MLSSEKMQLEDVYGWKDSSGAQPLPRGPGILPSFRWKFPQWKIMQQVTPKVQPECLLLRGGYHTVQPECLLLRGGYLQSCRNASCRELATQQFSQKLPFYEAAPLGGLRVRPVQKCTMICLILLAYSLFLTGNKTCSYALPVVQSFYLCVCRGFSEMFRGLFHKQGDGGFTSGSTEIVNRSLKTIAVALDRAEAKPPDGRPHWGTASPPPASAKSS